jgi:hypothetical protein
MYFCQEILQELTSCNFIQCISAQMRIWSSLLSRSTHKIPMKFILYFLTFIIFAMDFSSLYEFLKLYKNTKTGVEGWAVLQPTAPRLGLAQRHSGLAGPC